MIGDTVKATLKSPMAVTSGEEVIEASGLLKFADSRTSKDKIQIIDEGQVKHTFIVPEGMMSDIVKPLWDTKVKATGFQKGNKKTLVRIRPIA